MHYEHPGDYKFHKKRPQSSGKMFKPCHLAVAEMRAYDLSLHLQTTRVVVV